MKPAKAIALCISTLLGLVGSVFAVEKWTPAQQEVVDVVQAWADAYRAGNVEQIIGRTAPTFSCWDFARPDWQDRESFQRSETDFYRKISVLAFELTPVAVQRDGDIAVVHGRHRMKFLSASGVEAMSEGSWSSSLIRRDGRWLFTSLTWIDDRPKRDDAAITAEVATAFASFKTAVERVDLAAALAVAADVPECRYTTSEGAVLDCAAWKQGHIEYFATVTAHRFFPKNQEITVLSSDAALVTWTGAMEIVPKEGAVLRVDPFSASFLFKRISGAWKLVHQQESCRAPQPIATSGTPTSAETELRAADAELVAAANARDLERWLACFEADATLMPSGAPSIAGKDAIRPTAAALMQCPDFAVAHTITQVEVLPEGISAWVTYDFILTANGEDGSKLIETGTDTTLYRKGTDGRWRVLVDIWNVVHPAPVAAATGAFNGEARSAAGAPAAFSNAFTCVRTKPVDRWPAQPIHESILVP